MHKETGEMRRQGREGRSQKKGKDRKVKVIKREEGIKSKGRVY